MIKLILIFLIPLSAYAQSNEPTWVDIFGAYTQGVAQEQRDQQLLEQIREQRQQQQCVSRWKRDVYGNPIMVTDCR